MNYKSEVIGKNGIVARVVAKSVSDWGKEIVTWEYEAPKCILAELNTHGMLAKNAQSSRAVPVKSVINAVRNSPVVPVHWGSNQAGMVAGEEIDTPIMFMGTSIDRETAWEVWANINCTMANAFNEAGYHKQIVNRPLEAFTMVRGVITATEFHNFFHLRYHPHADPYIQELAKCMWEAYELAEAEVLAPNEWHTPYVEHDRVDGKLMYFIYDEDGTKKYIDEGYSVRVSSVACGQVSFRKHDTTEETVDRVWTRLMEGDIIHASVTEHQAKALSYGAVGLNYLRIEGVTHIDTNLDPWSAKFKGWIMHRKLIPNEGFNGVFTPPAKD